LSLYNETDYTEALFRSGELRLKDHYFENASTGTRSKIFKRAINNGDWLNLSKLTYASLSSGNLGYYYLGLSAEKLNLLNAAQKYYELALGSYHPYGEFVVPNCEKINACNGEDLPNQIYTSIIRISNTNPNILLSKYMPVEEELVDWTNTILSVTSAVAVASLYALAAYGEAYSSSYNSSSYSSSQRNSPNAIYDADGGYWNIVGNTIFGPNGETYSINGNMISGPKGQTAIITGNSIISSDGGIITKAGNSYISSSGTTCHHTGRTITCF